MDNRGQNGLVTSDADSTTTLEKEQPVGVLARQTPPPLQSSTSNDCDIWRDYWRMQKQPWRTEQEIEAKREAELERCSAITPDIEQGHYFFKDMKLSRADVEWLLATHEGSQGPAVWKDKQQSMREGLDLRGADLRKVRLQDLPLACMRGGLAADAWLLASDVQREMAAVRLERANLCGAHLEGAILCGAHLEEADLRGAHLEGADLRGVHLAGANLCGAHLEGTILCEAHLEGTKHFSKPANLRMAFFDSTTDLEGIVLGDERYGFVPLADVHWGDVNLAVVDWTQVNRLGDEYEIQWKLPGEYQRAIRANRQLATVLRAQGLHDDADHYAYRVHVNQWLMRPQQAILPIVLRVFVRERMPLPKVLLRLEERRQGQRMPRHPLPLALIRLIPAMFVLLLIALLKPLVLLALVVLCVVALLSVLPVMRKRGRHPPQYRRAQKQLSPPGLAPQQQRRRQQWLLLMGFLLEMPKSRLPLLLQSPSLALPQIPVLGPLWMRWRRHPLPVITLSALLVLLLLFDDALVCYGRYIFSLFLNALAGFGYKPVRSLVWYLVVVSGCAVLYAVLGHFPPIEAFVFSLTSFHGRGFFVGNGASSGGITAGLATAEAVVGLISELSVIGMLIHRLSEK